MSFLVLDSLSGYTPCLGAPRSWGNEVHKHRPPYYNNQLSGSHSDKALEQELKRFHMAH